MDVEVVQTKAKSYRYYYQVYNFTISFYNISGLESFTFEFKYWSQYISKWNISSNGYFYMVKQRIIKAISFRYWSNINIYISTNIKPYFL